MTNPPVVLATNTVYVTNVVVAPAETNAATGAVSPPSTNHLVTPQIVLTYAPPVIVTNLVARPEIQGTIDALSQAPLPFAPLAGLVLGWAYTAYAAVRNRKTAVALVQGVETARRILNETPEGQVLDKRVKDALIEHQEAAGVLDAVGKLVNQYTGNTVR